jgi:tetratricopeptide (TPR) repeat protein
MPITTVDSLTGVYRICHLKRNWPFSTTPHDIASLGDSLKLTSEEERLAFSISFEHLPWEEAMSGVYDYYIRTGDLVKAGRVMETLTLEHPVDPAYYEKTAMVCGKLGDEENAIFYFRKAFYFEPSFERARYLFVLYLKLDRPAEAMPYLDYAINNNTAGLNLLPVKAAASAISRMQKELAADSANLTLLNRIASAYFKMGDKEAAQKYVGKVLRADPKNVDALSLKIKSP